MSKEIVKIILPIVTPSNTELIAMHYITQWRLMKSYMWELVAVGANDPKYKVKWKERRIVRFLSCRRGRLDYGNLAGGFKKLEDALVNMGLLVDDSERYADISYFQKVDRDDPRTEILILNGGNDARKEI